MLVWQAIIGGIALVLSTAIPSWFAWKANKAASHAERSAGYAQVSADGAQKSADSAVVELIGNGKGTQTEMLERIDERTERMESRQSKMAQRLVEIEERQEQDEVARHTMARSVGSLVTTLDEHGRRIGNLEAG